MNRGTYLAQATQTPVGGASNATDFQPLTQNPQTAPTNLQQGTGPQSAGGQDILNNQNARISVPVSSGEPSFSPVEPAVSGINWAAVLIATVVIVVLAEAILRIWGRQSVAVSEVAGEAPRGTPHQEPTVINESSPPPVKAVAPPAQRPKKSRKSKSKRKRK